MLLNQEVSTAYGVVDYLSQQKLVMFQREETHFVPVRDDSTSSTDATSTSQPCVFTIKSRHKIGEWFFKGKLSACGWSDTGLSTSDSTDSNVSFDVLNSHQPSRSFSTRRNLGHEVL